MHDLRGNRFNEEFYFLQLSQLLILSMRKVSTRAVFLFFFFRSINLSPWFSRNQPTTLVLVDVIIVIHLNKAVAERLERQTADVEVPGSSPHHGMEELSRSRHGRVEQIFL